MKKQFANENLITTIEKKKAPLIGMPEKDSDTEDDNYENILPLIQEKEDRKIIREKPSMEDPAIGFINNIITSRRKQDSGGNSDMEKEFRVESEAENDNGSEESFLINTRSPETKKKQEELKRKAKKKQKAEDNLVEGLADIAAEEIEKGTTYDDSLEPDMTANEAMMKNFPDSKKKRSSLPESENIGNRIAGLSEMEAEEDRPRWKDAAKNRTHEMAVKYYGGDANFETAEMQKIKDWSFDAQRMDNLKEPSWWRRFLTRTAVGAGKLLKVATAILTGRLFWFLRGKNRSANEMNNMQRNREHGSVPGWQEGAKFDSDKNNGTEILADFRRVPMVFSKLTAAPALDENGKPMDPVITVYIDQPKSNSEQALNGMEMGHTMIGIEYSRKSKITGQWERYNLQYGFYPVGSTVTTLSGGMMALTRNAIVPGQLRDDTDHPYDISRRYPATVQQVNAILKASETYADEGYGYYDRNCTTFVKEMVVDKAHLATGGEIFKWSEIGFSNWGNFGMFGGTAASLNAQGGVETTMMDLAGKNDLSYPGYGNKRTTGKDYVNYIESLKNKPGNIKHTFIPGMVGEMMRRTSGPQAGDPGSKKYAGTMRDKNDPELISVGFPSLDTNISAAVEAFRTAIGQILPAAEQQKVPSDLSAALSSLNQIQFVIGGINTQINSFSEKMKNKKPDYKYADAFTTEEIRTNRSEITKAISAVNIVLQHYFNNDKRLHIPAMNLISLLNFVASYLDKMYREKRKGVKTEGDLGDIRNEMSHNRINVSVGGVSAEFSPSRYESYIQIYKTSEAAVKAGARLLELRRKEKGEGKLTSTEEKKLKRLSRLNSLAENFDSSHRYMLENDDFSQQDIDYVFQLRAKEKQGTPHNIGPVAEYKTSSGIYMSLMLEKIFGGMKYQLKKGSTTGIRIINRMMTRSLRQTALSCGHLNSFERCFLLSLPLNFCLTGCQELSTGITGSG